MFMCLCVHCCVVVLLGFCEVAFSCVSVVVRVAICDLFGLRFCVLVRLIVMVWFVLLCGVCCLCCLCC